MTAALQQALEALRTLIDQCWETEKTLTEELYKVDYCGESLPLCNARAAIPALEAAIRDAAHPAPTDADVQRVAEALQMCVWQLEEIAAKHMRDVVPGALAIQCGIKAKIARAAIAAWNTRAPTTERALLIEAGEVITKLIGPLKICSYETHAVLAKIEAMKGDA